MYVDLAGLARYKSDFGAWARGKLLPKDAAFARVRTAKAGAVSFVPVQETPLDVSVDFLFSETGPVSGDKGPDNPSTISGVNRINLVRANSNLLPYPYWLSSGFTANGITYIINEDGSVSATGTAESSSYFPFLNSNSPSTEGLYLTTDTYKYFGCPEGGSWNNWGITCIYGSTNTPEITNYDYGSGGVIKLSKPGKVSFAIRIAQGVTVSNLTFYPRVQIIEAPFEKNEQDAYNIDLGGTYYGGTLDVATGVMTVTWEAYKCTGSSSEGWFLDTVNSTSTMNYFRGVPQITHMMGNVSAATRACTHFVYSPTSSVVPSFATWSQTPRVVFRLSSASFPDVATLTSWLASEYNAGHPVTVAYALDQPYAVQLTPIEILSLTQSSVYDPRVNTVYGDAQAVQVGYLKHPSAASSELRNAIVSLGGGI